MESWKNVTNTFSEKRRHYRNTYLEICEAYDEAMEVFIVVRKMYMLNLKKLLLKSIN